MRQPASRHQREVNVWRLFESAVSDVRTAIAALGRDRRPARFAADLDEPLARLELPAVRQLLAERTAFAPGRELSEALFPTSDLREAERLQDETAAARDLLVPTGDLVTRSTGVSAKNGSRNLRSNTVWATMAFCSSERGTRFLKSS